MADQFTADQFAWLNQVAADHDLPSAAFKLAYIVGRHVNREKGCAWPGQESLARAIGTTVRTVRSLTENLIAQGHLDVEVHRGRGLTNVYRMLLKGKPASAFAAEERKIDAQKPETACAKTGSGLPTNPLTNPLKNPAAREPDWKLGGGEGVWVECESPQGDAWRRHWRAQGRLEAVRSGRTGYYARRLPSAYPPGWEG
jgi:hypothetical protein